MIKSIFHVFVFILACQFVNAQSFYFGPKIGPSLGFQTWNDQARDPLFAFNGDVFIETAPEDEKNYLYASLGFHTRGSSWRFSTVNPLNFSATKFKYRNAVLELGIKRMLFDIKDNRPFYFLGIRGEYNISTNLNEFDQFGLYFPNKAFVQRFVYGGSFGGGYEFSFRPLIKFFVEAGLYADFNDQFFQPSIPNVPDPFSPGRSITLQERSINNLTFEIKFGMKFLRKVEYID